ncbi:carboxylesterase/lipase family protein [Clostridium oryzae]|uniref:Carboxylic ester hydrolase n=1 Tax=Clostridium oryzae TaxID=1450648 RepID=A0A1V4IKE6_9CLOT|nr:carboxylesterase family protein [Clostridium oryzae]OPJ60406.1 carboxylesterase [Clostridium oryzae]
MGIGIVKTKKGDISGVKMKGYTLFKGIPYAKPPVGELRFKAPVELDSWEEVYRAENFESACMQASSESNEFYTKEFYSVSEYKAKKAEDCLYLNIWTPAEKKGEKLPVAFWIHGGAFTGGYGHEMEFDGEAYCKKGVILVTINYRLGAFGFLVHPWLIEENASGRAGNYGILDQIAALKWVYENIEEFGGDHENITVMGQSAGSISAQTLVSSELTEEMIKKAIFQSGGGYNGGLSQDFKMEEAVKIGEEFINSCQVSSLKELRKLPAEIIEEKSEMAIMQGYASGRGLVFIPVMDNYVLKTGYDELVDKGSIKDIAYMAGSTKNDIFITSEMMEKGEHGPIYDGCINWSLKCQELGRNPAYVYYFTRDLPGDNAGAFHSSELWYMFGTLNRCWRPMEKKDYELSEKMIEYWTNFMKRGDPNSKNYEEWKPYKKEKPFIMELSC